MARIETVQIPADNEAGYVIVNVEDVGTEAVAKWGSKADQEPAAKPLSKMNKGELLDRAEELGVETSPEATNKEIAAAIEAAEAEIEE